MIWQNAIAISIGAVGGALARYYIGIILAAQWGQNLPYGTFFVNLTGCFLMGAIVSSISQKLIHWPPEVVMLLTIGFLGSYTTFSSYILDSAKLLEAGKPNFTLLYWLGSPVCGWIGLKSGMILCRWLGHFGTN